MSNHYSNTINETLTMFKDITAALELIIGNNEPYTDITTANDAINEAILQRNVLRGEQRARAALFVEKGKELK